MFISPKGFVKTQIGGFMIVNIVYCV